MIYVFRVYRLTHWTFTAIAVGLMDIMNHLTCTSDPGALKGLKELIAVQGRHLAPRRD